MNEEWLAKDPGTVLTALAQFTRQSPDVHVSYPCNFLLPRRLLIDIQMRSFAAVLLRRLAFRPMANASRATPSNVIYDHLQESTRKAVESLLLDCITHESSESVRGKVIDTATEFAEGSLDRNRESRATFFSGTTIKETSQRPPGPWPELQALAAQYAVSSDYAHREIAYRIFGSIPRLLLDQEIEEVVGVLQLGLSSDPASTKLAALEASVAFLIATDKAGRDLASQLLTPMLNVSTQSDASSFLLSFDLPSQTLPPLPPASLAPYLNTLIPLATTQPGLFRPHLSTLITYLPPLVRSTTRLRTSLSGTSSNDNLPATDTHSSEPSAVDEDARHAALELLITLTEAMPKAAQACPGWIPGVVSCCLEGMTELNDDAEGDWLDRDVSTSLLTRTFQAGAESPGTSLPARVTRMATRKYSRSRWIGRHLP